jgi:hypothetical protein
MSDWQPIETAPKDGTQILSYGLGGDQDLAVIAWDTRGKSWFLCDGDQRDNWIGVTHWMSLPLPPSQATNPLTPVGDDSLLAANEFRDRRIPTK